MLDDLERLQADMEARIKGCSFFKHVSVWSKNAAKNAEVMGIENIINDALLGIAVGDTGRQGCGIVIFSPEVTLPGTDTPGPEIAMEVLVTVSESFLYNRAQANGTGVQAGAAVLMLLQLFDQWSPRTAWVMRPDAKNAARENNIGPEGRSFDMLFRVPVNLAPQPVCSMPTITKGGSTTTITSGETGVSLHFTTDESLPTRESPVYSTALPNLPSGSILRAIAAKDAHFDSSPAFLQF